MFLQHYNLQYDNPTTILATNPGHKSTAVVRLNFKTSRVGAYNCFTSLSEIERKFFVFVAMLEKRDSDAL